MTLRVVPEFGTWYEREHPEVLGSMLALSGDADVAAAPPVCGTVVRVAVVALPAAVSYDG